MSEILVFSCGTTVENIGCKPGIGGLLVDLEIQEEECYVDPEGNFCKLKITRFTVEQQNLRPLIQWLTLLELELK